MSKEQRMHIPSPTYEVSYTRCTPAEGEGVKANTHAVNYHAQSSEQCTVPYTNAPVKVGMGTGYSSDADEHNEFELKCEAGYVHTTCLWDADAPMHTAKEAHQQPNRCLEKRSRSPT